MILHEASLGSPSSLAERRADGDATAGPVLRREETPRSAQARAAGAGGFPRRLVVCLAEGPESAMEMAGSDPDTTVRVFSAPPPAVDPAWVEASALAPERRTRAQCAMLELSDALTAELLRAEHVTLIVDASQPDTISMASRWLDLVSRIDLTFHLAPGRTIGLLAGKSATIRLQHDGPVSTAVRLALLDLRDGLSVLGVEPIDTIHAAPAPRPAPQHEGR